MSPNQTFAEREHARTFGLDKPEEPEKKLRKKKTMDEIMSDVTEIADDKEAGADRFRALKMLAAQNVAAAVLPDPMENHELVERLARLMKAAGIDICQLAYQRAFPAAVDTVATAPKLGLSDLPPEIIEQVQKVRSLKTYYKYFPEVKRHGFPPGYPAGRGHELQIEWLRRAAGKILLDREQAKMNANSATIAERDAQIRGTDAGNESDEPGEQLREPQDPLGS